MLGRDWSTQNCSGKHPSHPKYLPQQEISHEIVEKKIFHLYDQQCILSVCFLETNFPLPNKKLLVVMMLLKLQFVACFGAILYTFFYHIN